MKFWLFLFVVFVFACSNSDDKEAENSASSLQSSSSLIIEKSGSLVQVGSQIWFAENSNAEPRKGNKWCYGNFKQNCDIYGGLYDWEAASNVCPNGYRLPSKRDFDVLLGLGEKKIGELLNAPSVFNVQLGGQKILDGFGNDFFVFRGQRTFWWTSSDNGVRDHAHCYEFNGTRLYPCTSKKTVGLSVRCILNGDKLPSSSSDAPRSSSSSVLSSSSSSVESSSSSSASSSSSVSRCGEESSGDIYNPETEDCCVTKRFTIETHFCLDDKVVEKCDGSIYENTHFCLEGNIVPLCGGSTYTSSQFCFEEYIFNKCGEIPSGAIYVPKIEECCGTSKYDTTGTSTQFCFNDEVYNRCGNDNKKYDPDKEFCLGNMDVEEKCENHTKEFLPSQFCNASDEVKDRCGGISIWHPTEQACCGTEIPPYPTKTHFCLEGKVKEKCENHTKDYTSSEFCLYDRVRNKCGGNEYNPDQNLECCGLKDIFITTTHFCYQANNNYKVEPLCGGQDYREYQFCLNNEVHDRCGTPPSFLGDSLSRSTGDDCCGLRRFDTNNTSTRDCCGKDITNIIFNPETHFCHGNQTYSCGYLPYDPSTHGCCGTSSNGNAYILGGLQFCYNNTLYNKCNGTTTYDPSTQRCEGGVVLTRCGTTGNNYHNPSTQFCYGSEVRDKCNGTTVYDPNTQRCPSGVVETRCGSSWYVHNPGHLECQNNVIVERCGTTGNNWLNINDPHIRCENGVMLIRCGTGDNWYDPDTEICCDGTAILVTDPCVLLD
ncbi:MAG: hypothetical protein LBU89_01700 [Fibromonadaceae bacterium]|jgi:uncharacterized protein (TIGR02145 family)|nr:hypothetical protein [Fibromonadaceae bacterium]